MGNGTNKLRVSCQTISSWKLNKTVDIYQVKNG